jgi:mRNA interferase YafQ
MNFGSKWEYLLMLDIDWTTAFKRDLKKFKHNKDIIKELDNVIKKLRNSEPLPIKNKDHYLQGEWSEHRECHVMNDVLLIYRTDPRRVILVRFGSHSELFG